MYDKHDAGSGDDDDDDRTGWNINTSEAAGILLMMDMRGILNEDHPLNPQKSSQMPISSLSPTYTFGALSSQGV
jgi:hypothetical protein